MAEENGNDAEEDIVDVSPGQSRGSAGLGFENFKSLMRRAALVDYAFSTTSGNFTLKFSGGRSLIVERRDEGFGLHLDTVPEREYQAPVPLIFDALDDYTLETTAEILSALNELYAIVLLVQTGRSEGLGDHMATGDKASTFPLLTEDDKPLFVSISQGSWFGDMWSKTKAGFNALKTIGLATSEQGREIMLRRATAETEIKEAEADAARSDAIAKRIDNLDRLAELYENRIKNLDENDPVRVGFEDNYLKIQDFSAQKLIDKKKSSGDD